MCHSSWFLVPKIIDKLMMLTFQLLILLLLLGCPNAQIRRSLWRKYQPIPGKLNCQEDGLKVTAFTVTNVERYCVARREDEYIVIGGYIGASSDGSDIRYYYPNFDGSGNFMNTTDLSNVDVLDVDPTFTSWIPISLNPPNSMLIEPSDPVIFYPRMLICRTKLHHYEGYVLQALGFTLGEERVTLGEERVCYTFEGARTYATDYEVLALNAKAKFFYDYGFNESQICGAQP